MVKANKKYEWAEEAVGFYIQKHWPDLSHIWPGITPQAIGLSADDWLNLSERMLKRYRDNSGVTSPFGEAARKPFHTQMLIAFVVALAGLNP